MKRALSFLFALLLPVASFGQSHVIRRAVATAGGGGGGPSTFANDTFTGSDGTLLTAHTSDSGHSWTLGTGSTGNGALSLNQLKDNAGNGPVLYSSAVPASADYDVEAQVTGTSDVCGPAGRISTSANTLYFVIWVNGSSQWRLRKRVAGVESTVTSGTFSGADPDGVTRTVKLYMRGTTLRVYFDGSGTPSIDTTDSAISDAGRPGVAMSGRTSDRMDNWSATNG